jgi:hypothetical protein
MAISMEGISKQAKYSVVDAVSDFAKLIKNEDGGFLPQVFVRVRDKRSIVFVTAESEESPGTGEDHVAAGRRALENLQAEDGVDLAALTYYTFLTMGGMKTSAVVAEVIECGKKRMFSQRYSARDGAGFTPIGMLTCLRR